MTKNSSRGEFNTFVGGLVTEASALNFPEQAARDIENFELNKDGTINRRPGFGFEQNFQYIDSEVDTVSIVNGGFSSYVWEDPAGQSGEKILVLQCDDKLKFYSLNATTVSLEGFIAEVTFPATDRTLNKGSYAAVDGKLVITTGDTVVYLVTYSPLVPSFAITSFALKTRDIWGLSVTATDDNPNARPASGTSHLYNLYNQSWAVPRNISAAGFALTDVAANILATYGYYPADTDIVWQAMIVVPNGSNTIEVFDPATYRSTLNESSGISRGFFIIDLLSRGASRSAAVVANKAAFSQATLATLTTVADTTSQGATVVCEYSGRIFYAGFGPTTSGDARSPDLSSYIAFSRLIRNSTDFSKCYQEGDPTSRETSDVVDTDGGLIRISGATNIRRMIVQGRNLIVIADNGVWAIEGGSDFGFSASNYKVDKISTFGGVNSDSVISDGSKTYFWAEDSIYVIQRNELGDLIYQSISEERIASFYNEITTLSKISSKGIYDKVSKKLRWIYSTDGLFSAGTDTKELVFDLNIGAYYKNTITNLAGTAVLDLFTSSPFVTELIGDAVFAGVERVFVGLDDVFTEANEVTDNLQTVKYIAGVDNGVTVDLTIAWFNRSDFSDWEPVDNVGVDAKAYLLTGNITAADSSIHKQTPLLVVHMTRTENAINSEFELARQSGCFVRTLWGFANSINSNKFSPLFQVYRYRRPYFSEAPGPYDNGFELVTTRNKLRGRGRAFSLYMETEPMKDCKIVGWNLSVNGNTVA